MGVFSTFYQRVIRRWLLRSEAMRLIAITASVVLAGTLIFARLEGWTKLDALYTTIITMTTIGYGDVTPQTPAGRIFAIFFSFISVAIAGYALSSFAANIIENRALRRQKFLRKQRMKRIDALTNHYIVCGADMVGRRIAEQFYTANAPYILIDEDEERLKETLLFSHPEYFQRKLKSVMDVVEVDLTEFEEMPLAELAETLDTPYILDDPMNDTALVQAGIERAKGLMATMPDERDNFAIVVGAKALAKRFGNEELLVMARVENTSQMRKMYLAGADFVRTPAITVGQEMAMHMANPEIGKWWYTLMGVDKADAPKFSQKVVGETKSWVGKTVGDLHREENVVSLSVKRDDKFITPPEADMVLQAADILITLSH